MHGGEQSPGIAPACVVHPSYPTLLQLSRRPGPVADLPAGMPEPTPRLDHLPALQTPTLWPEPPSQEGDPFRNRTGLRARVDGQPKSRQPLDHRQLPTPQLTLAAPEEKQVIHIPDVPRHPEFTLHEVVEPVQIDVRPELAGEVPDGEASWAQEGEQVVSRKVDHVVLFGEHSVAASQDQPRQIQDPGVAHLLREGGEKDLVIDAGEELPDVETEHKRVPPGEVLSPVQRPMGALAYPVGVAVVDEASLEGRLHSCAKGMVHQPVAEWGGTDQAPFGFPDLEAPVRTRAIASGTQLVRQFQEVLFQTVLERRHLPCPPLAARCPTIGRKERGPGEKMVERRDCGLGIRRLGAPPLRRRPRPRAQGRRDGAAVLRPAHLLPELGRDPAPPFLISPRKARGPAGDSRCHTWRNVDATTRKPLFLFLLSG